MVVRRRAVLFSGVVLTVAAAAGTDWPTHCQWIHPTSGLPPYAYCTNTLPSLTVRAESLPFVPVEQAARRLRYYQFLQPVLEVDHCSIAQVVLVTEADGTFRLTLRAEQNPRQTGGPGLPSKPDVLSGRIKQTGHLKRNLFFVRVKGLGAAQIAQPAGLAQPARPVFFDLPVAPFMVQNGEPFNLDVSARDDNVARNFGLVDRVEVSFFYR
jgi:hypothetical protein